MADVRTAAFRRILELAERRDGETLGAELATRLREIHEIASSHASSRESAAEKGRRLLVEGRLTIKVVHQGVGYVEAECRGDSGEVYALGFDPAKQEWRCTCEEKRGRCSHLAALQLVTVLPKGP